MRVIEFRRLVSTAEPPPGWRVGRLATPFCSTEWAVLVWREVQR